MKQFLAGDKTSMKRYKIESGGAVWTISSDRNLSRDEIAKAFVEDLKQGRAPDVLGLIARIHGPGLSRHSFIVLPFFLRKHGLIDERECRRLFEGDDYFIPTNRFRIQTA